MQHDRQERSEALADIWRAAEHQRGAEIGIWIKGLFASKMPEAASPSKPIGQGVTARA
jgi:hypothetical protein